jgi:phage tail protein X
MMDKDERLKDPLCLHHYGRSVTEAIIESEDLSEYAWPRPHVLQSIVVVSTEFKFQSRLT